MKVKGYGILKVLRCVCLSGAIALGLITILGTGGGGDDEAAYQLAEYRPLGEFDLWLYRTDDDYTFSQQVVGTESIGGVNASKVVREPAGGYQLLTNTDGIKLYKVVNSDGDGVIFNPPAQLLPKSANIGTTHSSSGSTTITSGGVVIEGTYSISAQVAGLGHITVLAGTFNDCLKITSTLTWDFGGVEPAMTEQSTRYLAEGVGNVYETITVGGTTTTISLVSALIGGVSYSE